jgi:hypothetical protein
MPLLLLIIPAIFIYMWLSKRNSTLTRTCRWREDRAAVGEGMCWRCAACGAEMRLVPGKTPRDCLRGNVPATD